MLALSLYNSNRLISTYSRSGIQGHHPVGLYDPGHPIEVSALDWIVVIRQALPLYQRPQRRRSPCWPCLRSTMCSMNAEWLTQFRICLRSTVV